MAALVTGSGNISRLRISGRASVRQAQIKPGCGEWNKSLILKCADIVTYTSIKKIQENMTSPNVQNKIPEVEPKVIEMCDL